MHAGDAPCEVCASADGAPVLELELVVVVVVQEENGGRGGSLCKN